MVIRKAITIQRIELMDRKMMQPMDIGVETNELKDKTNIT